ncbi:hypothetical protein ACFFK9_05085 [Gluconobacter kanchanaburiensis]
MDHQGGGPLGHRRRRPTRGPRAVSRFDGVHSMDDQRRSADFAEDRARAGEQQGSARSHLRRPKGGSREPVETDYRFLTGEMLPDDVEQVMSAHDEGQGGMLIRIGHGMSCDADTKKACR